MSKYYLLLMTFPLLLLSSCSYLPTLTSTEALDILEGIEYHQANSSFAFPDAFTIVIEDLLEKNETELYENDNVKSDVIKTITYDKNNNYFAYSVVDKIDNSKNKNYYYFAIGLSLYEAIKTNDDSYYHIYDNYTYLEIKELIRQKALSYDAFNILLGVKEVNDLSFIFYNSYIGKDNYQSSLEDDTVVNVFNHIFVSPDINSLKVKEDIVYTYDNDDGEYNIVIKTTSNRDIQFEDNLMIKDYENKEIDYKYNRDGSVIRTYYLKQTSLNTVSLEANIESIDLTAFTKK